jgi:hypothetical protein
MFNNPSMRICLQEEFVSLCLISATCVQQQQQPLLLQLYVACTPQSELSGISQHAVYHRSLILELFLPFHQYNVPSEKKENCGLH